ncbi:MAG TPA: cytochrome P450 [Acidimicrobiia bacterium]
MFDPFDASQSRDSWPVLAEMRAAGPVVDVAGGLRYVTRHEPCRDVLRDTTAFSNANGMKAPGIDVPMEDRLLGELDPPRHAAVRRIMVTALTPKVVHAAEAFIRATAAALLDALPPRGVDLVAGFTVPLPNRVTVHLLGFEPGDATQLARWAKELMESSFPATNQTERGVGFAAAFPEFAGYIDERLDERAEELAGGEARDDVLAKLLSLTVDGEPLPRRQVRALVRNLITGGLTTTSQLLANLVHQLCTVPGLESAVRADARALDTAIEESLRITPPILFVARGCVSERAVEGCPIHAGERVVVGLGSANRDEDVFADPDAFRVDRENADAHLTFGFGPHVCPGAALARVEARIALEVLLEHFDPGTLRLAPGFAYEHVPTFFECGPRHLPLADRG